MMCPKLGDRRLALRRFLLIGFLIKNSPLFKWKKGLSTVKTSLSCQCDDDGALCDDGMMHRVGYDVSMMEPGRGVMILRS